MSLNQLVDLLNEINTLRHTANRFNRPDDKRYFVPPDVFDNVRTAILSLNNQQIKKYNISTVTDCYFIHEDVVVLPGYDLNSKHPIQSDFSKVKNPAFSTPFTPGPVHYVSNEDYKNRNYIKFSLTAAAVIVNNMAATNTTTGDIAKKLEVEKTVISSKLIKLVSGEKFENSLEFISDIALVLGTTVDWNYIWNHSASLRNMPFQ